MGLSTAVGRPGRGTRPHLSFSPLVDWRRGSGEPLPTRTPASGPVSGQYNTGMSTISIQEIQRDPLAFLRRVEAGEAFLVLRDDQAVAEVKPVPSPARQLRPFALCAGEFTVPADFDEPLPESVLEEFEGR
jgi:antitoxin (DNA-binding transcriptional repressor) of toxin-antitoxin stability system